MNIEPIIASFILYALLIGLTKLIVVLNKKTKL